MIDIRIFNFGNRYDPLWREKELSIREVIENRFFGSLFDHCHSTGHYARVKSSIKNIMQLG